jgi:pimeloyl-ACP methyl ester carboxylesterase
VIRAADGRLLSVLIVGEPKGDPVFVLHGTPGVREMFEPELIEGFNRSLQYISYSRPGYGGSDRQPGRSVADCASDVRAIADQLGVQKFYVIGESGGGPHALACAALLADRVRAIALLAAVVPIDAVGLDWEEGMGEGNIEELREAQQGSDALRKHLEREIQGVGSVKTVAQLRAVLDKHLCASDRIVFDGGYGPFLLAAWKQIAKGGIWGWFDDDLALYRDWGFDFGDVNAPVAIWQGGEDLIVPLTHGRWLAKNLPEADFRLLAGEGHISLVANRYGAILDGLIAL